MKIKYIGSSIEINARTLYQNDVIDVSEEEYTLLKNTLGDYIQIENENEKKKKVNKNDG